jgi:sugar phosphate isomerase/epimerase
MKGLRSMKPQQYETKRMELQTAFLKLKAEHPERLARKMNLSWSNWGFGIEPLEASVKRLATHGIRYIELHGNRYGQDLGYRNAEMLKILKDHGVACSGICGMFSAENDMASNSGRIRQNALDYIKRNVELGVEAGAHYFLIVPAAVGRPGKIDDCEFERSVETLQIAAHLFEESGIRGAIEPIRSAEVSIVHTFEDAKRYIAAVGSPGIQHINGDVYHMQSEESHIATTLAANGQYLTNLHLADSNRCALGEGSMDVDAILMALYLIGYNNDHCFATPEPLGPGGDPYPAMFGKPNPALLDELVRKTAETWNEREAALRELAG